MSAKDCTRCGYRPARPHKPGFPTNLFDRFYYLNWFDYQLFGWAQAEGQPAAPRQWYVSMSKRF
jgi:hypothetical protein